MKQLIRGVILRRRFDDTVLDCTAGKRRFKHKLLDVVRHQIRKHRLRLDFDRIGLVKSRTINNGRQISGSAETAAIGLSKSIAFLKNDLNSF